MLPHVILVRGRTPLREHRIAHSPSANSRPPPPSTSSTQPATSPSLAMSPHAIALFYATMTGNAESLARDAHRQLLDAGHATTLHNLADIRPEDLTPFAERGAAAVFIVSTWGDGEPPGDACDFWYALTDAALDLTGLRIAVFGLGDRDYAYFNEFARQLEARLATLGATTAHPRCEADFDFDERFADWFPAATAALAPVTISTS